MINVKTPGDEGLARAQPCERSPARAVARLVLVATILGSAMVFIDGTIVNVALPALQRTLGATVVQAQWVVEAYTLFLSALMLVGSALGDHFGRRRVFALGTSLFAAASIWCGLAPDVTQLIVARAVQGVGGALLAPGSLALISAVFPQAERGHAIGIWSAWSGITAAVGPLCGGWLIDHLSWRWAFFINVPVALIVLVLLRAGVPESRTQARQLDPWGALLATAGLGGVVYGTIESSRLSFGHPLVVAALALGAAALAAFAVVEARVREPMVPFALFRSRPFGAANLLTFLLYGALGGALFFLPFNLIQVHGYSATAAGGALLPFVGIVFLLSPRAGKLADRHGPKWALVAGPAIAAGGLMLFARTGAGGGYVDTFLLPVSVLGVGMALTIAPLTTTVMTSVGAGATGIASGINNTVARVAGLLAIAALALRFVHTFDHGLDARLARLHLPPAVLAAIRAQHTRLAAIEIPGSLDPGARASIGAAIRAAFIDAFHDVMWIGAALALASALVALARIPARHLGPREEAVTGPGEGSSGTARAASR